MAHKPEVKEIPVWKNILFSGFSGAVATTCIYPIDLTKTKLQDQVTMRGGGGPKYTGPIDCAFKIFREGGIRGMYRGWPPNVLLVMPEKALKLTLNDFFRGKLKDSEGNLGLGRMVLAGGLAGFFQVTATNPMELLKIQGATQGDKLAKGQIKHVQSYFGLTRSLGLALYTGTLATLLRDIPFSMVYFPMYAILKERMEASSISQELGLGLTSIISGGTAATLAAGLSTPLDVIKTRVHSKAIPMSHSSLAAYFSHEIDLVRSQASTMLRQEGACAFWKGVGPRCAIIAPLFSIVMVVHEQLKFHFG